MKHRRISSRTAFTLVELLVVIGIIALLVSILLPSLSRAKETANRVKCLANLRTIGQAFAMYNNNNKGRFPLPAVNKHAEDWIYWEADRNFSDGPLMTYLGKQTSKTLFQCPSDDPNARRAGTTYRFSYSANYLILRLPADGWLNLYAPESNAPLRVTEIVNPSQKIVLIDEANDTVDDGCWAWMKDKGQGFNILSARHARKSELSKDPTSGRGNCTFADGHADYFSRKATFEAENYDPKKR